MYKADPLDIRDISIIDALPVCQCPKLILTVGAGHGRIEWHLSQKMGYPVIATDIEKLVKWEEQANLKFFIYDVTKYIPQAPTIICSQVLEHIKDYRTAYRNLVKSATFRLIITFPHEQSFHSPDHINFWNDKTVKEFDIMAHPYSTAISKIRTKPKDKEGNKFVYLLTIDKRQKYA